jgi:phosphoglycerate dehydrogenase-like enzyme
VSTWAGGPQVNGKSAPAGAAETASNATPPASPASARSHNRRMTSDRPLRIRGSLIRGGNSVKMLAPAVAGGELWQARPVLIVFIGESFSAARKMVAELLPGDEVRACPADELPSGAIDVLVPTMSRVDAQLMDRVQPRLIQQFGAGLEGVDLDAARERGIPVANVPAASTGNAASVAELAVLHLLALSRRLDESRVALRNRQLGEPIGQSLVGRTATVLGLGGIGREVLVRLRPFGARLLGVGRRPSAELDADTNAMLDAYYPAERLSEALSQSDLLILCTPLTPQTRGLIGAAELAALRPGSLLINVARGPVVDRDALLTALREGHLAGAGLDVFWDEPIDPADPILEQNVLATPHVGGVTVQAGRNTAQKFAANIERLRSHEPLEDRAA